MDLPVWNPEPPDWEFALPTSQGLLSSLSVKTSRPRLGVWWRSMLAEIDRLPLPFMWWYSSRFQEGSRSAEGLLSPAVYGVGSEPWRLVVMDAGRVSTYSSFSVEHLVAPCVGHGSWHLRLRSTRSQERTALFWYSSSHRPASMVLDFKTVRSRVSTDVLGVVPAKHRHQRIPPTGW